MRARRRLFHANVFDTFPPHGIKCRGIEPGRRAGVDHAARARTLGYTGPDAPPPAPPLDGTGRARDSRERSHVEEHPWR